MIIRIVKMNFHAEKVAAFKVMFALKKEAINSFAGCLHLELWHDVNDKNTLFTYSKWEKEGDLEQYKQSDFFKETWRETKALFASRAEAWSVMAE